MPLPDPLPPHERPTRPMVGLPSLAASVHFDPAAGAPRFTPIRLLGAGGIGRVHLVRDSNPIRICALKDLQEKFLSSMQLTDQFQVEIHVAGYLDHPNCMPLYTSGTDARGRPYYAMPYIADAKSLKSLIRQLHAPGESGRAGECGRVDLAKGTGEARLRPLLRRLLAACRGVAHANGRGVIHRDLKPENIMISPYEEVTYVSDWGMALITGLAPPGYAPELLLPHEPNGRACLPGRVGTPNYMSPECLRGETYDWRADVYSLGACLYEALTGCAPYHGHRGFHEILEQRTRGEPRAPRAINRTIDPRLEAIVLRAMAALPEARYPTADALADDLQHYLDDEPITAMPDGFSDWLAREWRKHRNEAATAAVALMTLMIFSIGAALRMGFLAQAADQARALAESRRVRVYDFLGQSMRQSDLLLGAGERAFGPNDTEADRQISGLQGSLALYELYLRDRSEDRAIHQLAGRATRRLGDLYGLRGEVEQARKRYEEGITHLRASSGEDSDVAEAEIRIELAYLHHLEGHWRKALEELDRAQELLASQADPAARRIEARAWYRRAEFLLARAQQHGNAPADIHEAGVCLERALRRLDTANTSTDRMDATLAHVIVADHQLAAGTESTQIAQELRQAREMVDVLASERTTPQDDVILALRCLIVTKQATLPAEARNAEIPAELDRAIDEMSRLATRMSRVPMYRALLAEAFLARARRQSDPAGALADAQRGLDLARALEQQQPTPENRWRAQEAAKIVEGLDARRREWEPCGGKIPPKLAPTTRISDFLRRVSPTGPILCT